MVIRSLLWVEENIAHVAEHEVAVVEVEQVVFGDRTLPAMVSDMHRVGRLVFFGQTDADRHLVVVLDRPTSAGDAYVVSARPMSPRERRQYKEQMDA